MRDRIGKEFGDRDEKGKGDWKDGRERERGAGERKEKERRRDRMKKRDRKEGGRTEDEKGKRRGGAREWTGRENWPKGIRREKLGAGGRGKGLHCIKS